MATDNVARGLAAHALSVAVAGGGDHPVESVNGKTGKVNLTAADVGAEPAGSGAEKLLRYDTINAYSAAQNKWATSAYRTLVFDDAPIGALRDWLTANGVKK